jgi:adenylosuccinate lyase
MAKSKIKLTELGAISPLDGRYWVKLSDLSFYVSEASLIRTRLVIETKYLLALAEIGLVRPLTTVEKNTLQSFSTRLTDKQIKRVKEIEEVVRHDVKAVERSLREFFAGTSLENVIEMLHFGLTSEDINNIAYRLMLKRATANICLPVFDQIIDTFLTLARKYQKTPMLARTHGQSAIPTTLGKEMINFASRLNIQVRRLESLRLTGKLNGAVGNYNSLVFSSPQVDWVTFSETFVKSFGLVPNLLTTQINFADDIIEILQSFERINNVIINIDTDMWRYISDNWFTQEVKKGEVGSSTMPQKVNPIDFENSKGNAEIANGMISGLAGQLAISWLQRDLSGSTTHRNLGAGLGYSLLAARSLLTGLKRVQPNEKLIRQELNKNWAILGEAVQTLLRKLGEKDPYSMVASLTRGQEINKQSWKKWVSTLAQEKDVISLLLKLTPDNYLGNAEKLVDLGINQIKDSRKQTNKLLYK